MQPCDDDHVLMVITMVIMMVVIRALVRFTVSRDDGNFGTASFALKL